LAVAVVRAPYSLSKLGRTGLVIYWKERIVNPALEAIENDSAGGAAIPSVSNKRDRFKENGRNNLIRQFDK